MEDRINNLNALSKQELRAWFNEIDKDRSGWISNKELYDFLVTSDNQLSRDERFIEKVYKRADENEDGKLDFREFVRMIHDPRNKDLFKTCLNKYIYNFRLTTALSQKYKRTNSKENVENAYEQAEYNDLYTCRPPPLAMISITILEIIIFSIDAINGDEFATGPIAQALLYHPRIRLEIWRFFTYMLVHVGYAHLIMNLLIQIFLGVILEMAHGWWRVSLVYTAGVLAGSLGTSIFDPNVKLAGASGGVYSLITAHVATIILNWKEMGFPVSNLVIFIGFTVGDVAHVIYTKDPYIGYVTHFCGALAGLLVGVMILRNIRVSRMERFLQCLALITYIGLMSVAIVFNLLS